VSEKKGESEALERVAGDEIDVPQPDKTVDQGKAAKLKHRRNAVTIAAAVKLGIFTVVSILVTGLLAAIMGNVGFGASSEYKAVFSNASMLEKGDDVRIAGVSVGEVKSVDHYERSKAIITFAVKADVPLTTASHAEIRFLNLVGDRYMALEEGVDPDGAKRLEAGDTLPISQTSPALDLTELFNGFKPLFQALTPAQVNELSMNLIQVLQGEGGTVQDLMAKTASLTTTLADRDQLIGEVIDNLGVTLGTVDQHHKELTTLVLELKRWMTGLARDRRTIGSSLGNISDLTVVVADLLRQSRPLVKSDVVELKKLARLLNKDANKAEIVELLDRLPESMTDQTRTGTYGSWYSYYVCGFSGQITLPPITNIPGIKDLAQALSDLNFHSTAPRCNGATAEGE
jgi:phospholipid/cholesterol/gamma-HCH transport system substrate-binding protein